MGGGRPCINYPFFPAYRHGLNGPHSSYLDLKISGTPVGRLVVITD